MIIIVYLFLSDDCFYSRFSSGFSATRENAFTSFLRVHFIWQANKFNFMNPG